MDVAQEAQISQQGHTGSCQDGQQIMYVRDSSLQKAPRSRGFLFYGLPSMAATLRAIAARR
jgi:hypothetical protein